MDIDVRTFIATATDPEGRSIRRQVEASDRKDALARLRGLGLTSIRLHEVLGERGAETARASLLRPAGSPPDVPARPALRLSEDTIRVEIPEGYPDLNDSDPPPHTSSSRPSVPIAPPELPRRNRENSTVERPTAPLPEPQAPPARRGADPPGRATPPSPLPSVPTGPPTLPSRRTAPDRDYSTNRLPSTGSSPTPPRQSDPSFATNRIPQSIVPRSRALAPVEEDRPVSLVPIDDDDEPLPTAGQWNAVDALQRLRQPGGRPVDLARARLSPVDRMTFFSGLANMLTVGIPMLRALASMQEQFTDNVTRAVMAELCRRLGDGGSLSDAMAGIPRAFTGLQIGSVRGGEKSGKLAMVLQRLYRYEERTLSLTRQLKAVLTYPSVVFGCSLLLVLFVGRSLVTGMSPALTQAGVQVNAITSLVMSLSKALDRPIVALLFLSLCGACAWGVARWLATPRGQDRRDRLLLRAPIVRTPLRMVETSRICEAMAALYGSGLTLLQCLEVATDACGNVVAREALTAMKSDLKNGKSLSEGMRRSGFFDRTVVNMVAVGEESGRLDMAFTKVAQYNDLEVRSALDQLAAAIEPLMFVVLGVVVGVIALVAFGPLYQLMGALS